MRTLTFVVLTAMFVSCTNTSDNKPAASPLYNYDIEQRLDSLGIELFKIDDPFAGFVHGVQSGNLLFLSGKGPHPTPGVIQNGKLGRELSVQQGYDAARLTAIEQLSVLKLILGDLNRVVRIVKVRGMVNATPDFTQHPAVINGFSDVMIEVFGERGKHARSAIGVASLPFNIPCEVEMVVEIKD